MSGSDAALLGHFQDVKATANGWQARCPAHDDRRASLSISQGDRGQWLLHCHAGCTLENILTAAALTTADLFPPRDRPRIITAVYDYQDESGALLYQAVRFEPKDFRQRVGPDGPWSITNIRRVPYRLPELHGQREIFVVEGEKDVDRLRTVGLVATCNVGGAGKWRSEYVELLKRAGVQRVFVLPDHDPPGAAHGLAVARSCHAAGLAVKLIALPGLPAKGDVSDYLEAHTTDDLVRIAREAPPFDPHASATKPAAFVLEPLTDFMRETDDETEWLLEARIPAGGLVLLAAAPKVGKSTVARELGLCVARGTPFLGWSTRQGMVWLLAFEDQRREVRRHLRQLGATGDESIRMFVRQAPGNLVQELRVLAEAERPDLIIIDTLGRAQRVKDYNDYAQVTEAFNPLLALCRSTGAAMLVLHHASAHQHRDGTDAVLGSTALSGSVDNLLILKRNGDQRVLSSVQRIGSDLEPTVIVLNRETGHLESGGRKRDVDDQELSDQIVKQLAEAPAPMTERAIQAAVEGRKKDQVRMLRLLWRSGRVSRGGGGKRNDPYLYSCTDSGSGVFAEITDRAESPGTRNTAKKSIAALPLEAEAVSGSSGSLYKAGTTNNVLTTLLRTSADQSDTTTANTESDSGDQTFDNDGRRLRDLGWAQTDENFRKGLR